MTAQNGRIVDMSFYVGDIPNQPFELEPPEAVDLDTFDAATATVVAPTGTATSVTAAVDASGGVVLVTLPTDASLFTTEGVYYLRVRMTGPDNAARRLAPVPVVVQDDTSEWHTLDSIRAEWADAERIPDRTLYNLLEVVRGQVLDFAPALADDAPVPENYLLGQRMQARNTWLASRVAPDGSQGMDDFVIRPHPLDWQVKQILRPQTAVGGIA